MLLWYFYKIIFNEKREISEPKIFLLKKSSLNKSRTYKMVELLSSETNDRMTIYNKVLEISFCAQK